MEAEARKSATKIAALKKQMDDAEQEVMNTTVKYSAAELRNENMKKQMKAEATENKKKIAALKKQMDDAEEEGERRQIC
ncbi:uncharacterized protein IUM83_19208 [Phytophthora cinnamomi]|uniref:uncharacterized protein n=1 Tax=Phytophthora cinnamomi TaxID=4785 RepID=UPI0035594E8B|nr:hypothetical protein IUM83_19208 [Phytophthora cinnamomi]